MNQPRIAGPDLVRGQQRILFETRIDQEAAIVIVEILIRQVGLGHRNRDRPLHLHSGRFDDGRVVGITLGFRVRKFKTMPILRSPSW